MNIRSTLAFLPVFVFSLIHAKAQTPAFELKDYQFRIPVLQGLQLNINLNGGVYDSKLVNSNNVQRRSFNTSPTIDYFRISSTDKRQHNSNIYLSPSYSSSFNSLDTPGTKSRSANLVAGYNSTDRFYFRNKRFFELENYFTTSNSNHRLSGNNTSLSSGTINFQYRLSAGIGKGRLEYVQDAQMAMFIINDLQKMNLLEKKASPGDMQELARLITKINNRRVFDNRIRRIYELTKIDSFLQATQLVKQSSIAYFTAVNDNWALAFNPGRQSGTIYYFRVRPSAIVYRNKNEQKLPANFSEGNNRSFSYGYETVAGVEKQQPVNLFWQRKMKASLSFVQEWKREKTEFQTGNNPPQLLPWSTSTGSGLLMNAFYGIGYYPNNRTIIDGGFTVQSAYSFHNFSQSYSGFVLSPGVTLSANYFISYKTRVTVFANAMYMYFDPSANASPYLSFSRSSVDANINIGFSHILF